MSRRDDRDNELALGALNAIASMYSTFANKELANAQIIARQEEQKINNAHLIKTHEIKTNLRHQENQLLDTYKQNQIKLENLKKDAKKLNLDIGTDFHDLEPEHTTQAGQKMFKDLGVEYIGDFNVRYKQGNNMAETLSNLGNANNQLDGYINAISNRLSTLHDDINFIRDDWVKSEGYPDGTPAAYIPAYENIIDSSDLRQFMDIYSEYHPQDNPNGFNIDLLENGVPAYMPEKFLTKSGDEIKKEDLVNAIANNNIAAQTEILKYWDNSSEKQSIKDANVLFDSTPDITNQIAQNRLEVWEREIFEKGGEVLPKSLFDRETYLENKILDERARERQKKLTAKTSQMTKPWEDQLINNPSIDRIRASQQDIAVKLGTKEYSKLQIVKDYGKGIKFQNLVPTPNNMKQNKAILRSEITSALTDYGDNDFRNISLTNELAGSGVEDKFKTMGDLLDKINTAGTTDEQDAYMKIFSDIVIAGQGQKSKSGKIWREGFLDNLDFSDMPFSGGDLKNVDILASWINGYDILDREFQGYDDGVNEKLAEWGYTYPKNLGQGRRMFDLAISGGKTISKLGYDLGIVFNNGVIEISEQDKEFFTNQNIGDKYLEEVLQPDGSFKYKLKKEFVKVVQGAWSKPS